MCVTSSMAAGWHQSQPLWVTWGPCRPGARAVHSPVGRRPGVQARDAQWRQMWRQDTQALRGRVGCCGSVNQMLQPCLPDLSAFCSPSSPFPLLSIPRVHSVVVGQPRVQYHPVWVPACGHACWTPGLHPRTTSAQTHPDGTALCRVPHPFSSRRTG